MSTRLTTIERGRLEALRCRLLMGSGRKAAFLYDRTLFQSVAQALLGGTIGRAYVELSKRFGPSKAPTRSALGRFRRQLLAEFSKMREAA